MDLKKNYALNQSSRLKQSLHLNERLFKTYNKITKKNLVEIYPV